MNQVRDMVLVAMLSAMLSATKLALAWLPNIEIVTLLLIVMALSLGAQRALGISITFVFVETLLWGAGIWVVMYVIYYPVLALIISLLPHNRARVALAIIIGVLMTVVFGVWTTVVEVAFMGGLFGPKWLHYITLRYASGLPFMLTHIICNAVLLPIGVPPLTHLASQLAKKTPLL